jgi:hypothetical protein
MSLDPGVARGRSSVSVTVGISDKCLRNACFRVIDKQEVLTYRVQASRGHSVNSWL